ADDVTKTASVDAAGIGDTIGYDITVQPNVTPADLTYTVTDTVPDGLSIDEASVTGDGVVDGQTITWEVDVPTQVGAVGSYVASTPADSPQCAAASRFVDLEAVGVGLSSLDGDTVAVNAFSEIGPFTHYGDAYPGLTVSDDGLVTVTGGYGGQPWAPQELPAEASPNGVIAPLWADYQLSQANGRGVRLATSNNEVAVIQWDDPFPYGADPADLSNSVGTFQAWVYKDASDSRPEIRFEYGDVGALPASATIGIENLAGTLGTAVVNAGNPADIVTDGDTICFDYVAPDLDPVALSYEVTVAPDAVTGTYTNSAEHVTDNPFDEPAVTSVDVDVTGVPDVPAWDRKAIYTAGDEVLYDGSVWVAQWWTKGQKPGATPWGPWAEVGVLRACAGGTYPAWTSTGVYDGGETVVHDGHRWTAQWYSRNQEPSATPWGPWRDLGGC
ncbi:MAG TPA: carbohydrate-binding protein, partial [Nocardioides sp.]